MRSSILELAEPAAPFDPKARGYLILYRTSETNHCPGCGRVNWYVGRQMAECAFCSTALFLDTSDVASMSFNSRGKALRNFEGIAA